MDLTLNIHVYNKHIWIYHFLQKYTDVFKYTSGIILIAL